MTLQILPMEPLHSLGVGYQHHPVVFHLREMLGYEHLDAVEPSWDLAERTGLVLMPGVHLFQNPQSSGSPAEGTGKFLLTFPVLLISVLMRLDQVVLPALELCAQRSYLM